MSQPPARIDCDIAVIGAGSAGLPAWQAAHRTGQRSLLIEGGEHGTMCARVGCMPSKLLIAAADAAAAIAQADGFGVRVDGPVRIDGAAVMERVRAERDRFVGAVKADVAAMPAAARLDARVEFTGDAVLRTDDGRLVHAARIILATGTRPNIPAIYRELGPLVAVNEDVFEWRDLPASVLVIGAGPIGVELGLALARLGVRVRLLNHSATLAGIADPVVHRAAVELLGPGLGLVLDARVGTVREEAGQAVVGWTVGGGPETLERFDRVLVAAGRHPTLAEMHLERTSMPLDERGMPRFDPTTLQVDGQPVFLAGDVTGQHAIQHEAVDDGRIAGHNAAAWPDVRAMQRRAPMGIVFSAPQVMQVGGGFAAQDPGSIAIGQTDWARQARARVMRCNAGILRVYMRRDDQRFLGAEMIGPDAEHIAHLLAWARQMELTVPQLLDLPYYHPTTEEGIRPALIGALRQARDGGRAG